jgi:hypothetical protein
MNAKHASAEDKTSRTGTPISRGIHSGMHPTVKVELRETINNNRLLFGKTAQQKGFNGSGSLIKKPG